jgi:putative ABC transport system permease protein
VLDIGVVPGPSAEREIVGIVRDVKLGRLDERAAPVIYVPHSQYPAATMSVVVKTAGDPMSAAPLVRRELGLLDRDLSLQDVQPMSARLAGSSAAVRFRTLLLTSFGAVALVLAMVGLYAVVAYSTAQRTHEIGVRMALGARPAQVVWLVFNEGMAPVVVGAALGIAGTIALSRLVTGLMFGISAADPATVAVVVTLLLFAALAACCVPALRATRVSPLDALRFE